MKYIEVLDCTLRDGGRLFNCEFYDDMITDMVKRLQKAKIDIIEVGFLRDERTTEYKGNSTFFTRVDQICRFLPKKENRTSTFVAFIDYGMYDFSTLSVCDGQSVDGIRFGFTKKNWEDNRDDVLKCMQLIKEKGYKLFVQNVNTPGYSDRELLEIIDNINDIKPYGYGIVDTYGSMYEDDIEHYFDLVNQNLDKGIRLDFHSHNNFQMSFALAQKLIKICELNKRRTIIDGTLNGMGKGAGNLNIELVVDYLERRKNYNYETDEILDLIDDYCKEIQKTKTWGYSLPGLFSGIYRCHPNNMIFLTDKFNLSSKDIRNILSSIELEKRGRYDYDSLQKIVEEYGKTKIDDTDAIEELKKKIQNKTVLLIMPGSSISSHQMEIEDCYKREEPLVMTVNFLYVNPKVPVDYGFFGSADRYKTFANNNQDSNIKVILTSSIKSRNNEIIVNYESLVERGNINFDNSAIMCLKLLKKCGVKKICIAGFDGYRENSYNYYENQMNSERSIGKAKSMNKDISKMFKSYWEMVRDDIQIYFITPSIYNMEES